MRLEKDGAEIFGLIKMRLVTGKDISPRKWHEVSVRHEEFPPNENSNGRD